HWAGAGMMMAAIVLSAYYGRRLVEISLTWGMIAFTSVLLVYVAVVLHGSGDQILAALAEGEVKPGWAVDGMRFAFYNSFVIPPLLYIAREFETRREVIRSGLISAVS